MQSPLTLVIADTNIHSFAIAAEYIRDIVNLDPICTLIHTSREEELLYLLQKKGADILILDLQFPESHLGVVFFQRLRKQHNKILIIPVIPEGDDELTKIVLALDTFFYIRKPYNAAEISVVIKRALEKISHSPCESASSLPDKSNFHGIIGKAPCMLQLFDLITRIAEDDFANVLIQGESGTGKELVAKAIHSHSRRKNNKFVPVNCAAIPEDLLESELFGHIKGAFTGAVQNKIGRIQYADGGTLFLDEIGDMKASLQAKLLRVLQEKEFEPVGALKAIPVDTRILAATHCDLEQLVKEGRFREDLYYRLSVIPLTIPSLSNRKEDIPLLLDFFIDSSAKRRGGKPVIFSKRAISALMNYRWRGNVRELENLVQHMSILYSGKSIELDDLPEKFHSPALAQDERIIAEERMAPDLGDMRSPSPAPTNIFDLSWREGRIDFNQLINDYETRLILHAMKITGGNKKEAAELLGLKRTTLLEKIKKKALTGLWEDIHDNESSD
jgi:DNA-binding NtrC family response regulator